LKSCSGLLVVAGMMTAWPALAQDKPSFGDLLVRAQAQAAAGHRWGPPGNNMTETIATMMDLIPTATPEQLTALSALLQNDAQRPSPAAAPTGPTPERASVASAEAVAPLPPPPKPAPLPVPPRTREAELFTRGQDAESHGDISGARRWYAAAADQGSATAARSVGRLYDPAYLKQMAQGGIDPDAALARHWYERAVAMGDAQAAPLLQALASR
jgi:TPR repeat protein